MKYKSTVPLDEGVELLKKGEVVGLPTETVYGLAADIFNEEALNKVFSVKARPFFDPLIVHVDSLELAKSLTASWNELHEFLAKEFWPGPLTLIAPKHEKILDLITSGLETVALRWPQHPTFQEAIRKTGVPLAAPSANRFGKTSPTTAEHVMKEFDYRVAVVDGGPSKIGLESTVVFPVKEENGFRLEILRPGGTTQEQLAFHLKDFPHPVRIVMAERQNSPGHLKHHYQPDKPLYIFQNFPSRFEALKAVREKSKESHNWFELRLTRDPLIAARKLYSDLRIVAEQKDCEALYIIKEANQTGDLWTAVWDRLDRASTDICNFSSTGF